MKNLFLTLSLVFGCNFNALSQVTSLVVECQNPGSLSNLIKYDDQLTLESIKVTGYINSSDLSFLGSLNKNQKLRGVINLEDVQIVGATNSDNNKITKGYFGRHIQHLIMPKSLVFASNCLRGATLDTLTIGGETLPSINSKLFYDNGITFNTNVRNLILRNGVTTIETGSFLNGGQHQASEQDCIFESIGIPSSLVTIEEQAFEGCLALKNLDLENVEELGEWAFAGTKIYSDNDTIILPSKLKTFHLNSFAKEGKAWTTTGKVSPKECYGNQHFYIPKGIETIDCNYVLLYDNCYLHIPNNNPPALSRDAIGISNLFDYIFVFVPKNVMEIYKNKPEWQDVTILAEPNPAKNINIEQKKLEIIKGKTAWLNATVLPIDADDTNYTWSTSNHNVVSITQEGFVTAMSSGEAKIYATLNVDKSIVDSCLVRVYQPVTEIKLNISSNKINVDETFDLIAKIYPADADNKKVIWSSGNCETASVDAYGTVTPKKAGETWVKVVSQDNPEAKDSCKVTVIQPVTGISLNYKTYELGDIGDGFELSVTVTPDDASNKNVKWTSSNESVCIVSRGMVVGVGYGTSVIIANTEDGGYMATCTVTVVNTTNVSSVEHNELGKYNIYNVNGSKLSRMQKGINIIRLNDGTSRKVLIK